MQWVIVHSTALGAAIAEHVRAANAWMRRKGPQIGQSMVEYAIIAALVAVAAIVAIRGLGTTVSGVFTNVCTEMQSGTQTGGGGGGGGDCTSNP
jgi:pilus assembly protein Flp/PilA